MVIPTVDGVTVQLAPLVLAQVPPVQVNDVAEGLQLDVRVELLPRTMVAGFAVRVQVGSVAAGAKTVNAAVALGAVAVVTTMLPGPTVAKIGTLVVKTVAFPLVIIAAAPPMVTVTPDRFVPLIVTRVPAEPDAGDIAVIVGGEAVWQASQSRPVAVTQAASMEAFPLETKRLVHRLLPPATSVTGGAGTGPDSRLLLTSTNLKAVNPLSGGRDPVKRLLLTPKICKAVSPLSVGIDPASWLN